MNLPIASSRRFLSILHQAFRVVIFDDLASGMLDLKPLPRPERWLLRAALLALAGVVALTIYYSLERSSLRRNWIEISLVQAQSSSAKTSTGDGLAQLSLSFAGPIGLPTQALPLCLFAIALGWGLILSGARRSAAKIYFPLVAFYGLNLWFFASLILSTWTYVLFFCAIFGCAAAYFVRPIQGAYSQWGWSLAYTALSGLFFCGLAKLGDKAVLSAGLIASQVFLLFVLTLYWLILGIDTIDAGTRVGRWLAGLFTCGPMPQTARYLIPSFLVGKIAFTLFFAPSLFVDAIITAILISRFIIIATKKGYHQSMAIMLATLAALSTVVVYYAVLSLSNSTFISAALFIVPPVFTFAFFTAYDFLGKGASFANQDTPSLPQASRPPLVLGLAILATTTMLFFTAARDDAFEAFSSQVSAQAVLISGLPFALYLLINKLPELLHIGAQTPAEQPNRVPGFVFVIFAGFIAIGLSLTNGLLSVQFARAAILTNRADALTKNRPTEALALYQKALKAFPAYYKGHFNLGVFYQFQKQPEDAAKEFQYAIDANPEYLPAYINLGVAFTSLHRIKEAEAIYYKAIKLDSKLAYAYNNLAVLENGRGQWAQAEKLARQGIAVAAQDRYEFYDTLGQALFEVGKWQEAETSLQKAVRLKPEAASTYNTLGLFYMAWGTRAVLEGKPAESTPRYRKALGAYETALAKGFDEFLIGTNLSQLYLDLGELKKAEALIQATIAKHPKDANLQQILGMILLRKGQKLPARAAFAAAKSFDPSYPYAWAGEALLDLNDGNYERCIQGYKEALQRNLDRDYVRINLSVCYAQLGRPREAMAALNATLAKGPSTMVAFQKARLLYEYRQDAPAQALWNSLAKSVTAEEYFLRGKVFAKRGDLKAAESDFRKSLTLDPSDDRCYSELGLALDDLGRKAEASDAYKKAIALNPSRAEPYVNLATNRAVAGDLTAAEAMYRKAIELGPELPEPRYGLGVLLAQKGQLAEAKKTAVAALANAPAPASQAAFKSYFYARLNLLAGQIENKFKNYSAAQPYLKAAIAFNPNSADGFVQLGLASSALGDSATALEAFTSALKLVSDPAQKSMLEGAIKFLKKRP